MNSSANLNETFPLLKQDELHLADMAKKHPWCSVAQLYLLNNYKNKNSENFEKQAAKTALFFKSQNWLQWQLHLLSEEDKIVQQDIFSKKEEISTKNNEEKIALVKDPIQQTSTVTTEELIAFEPLHTVDYFASQGIKITEEPITNDKLGSQMKSFTEWLKSMKKIHTENLPAGDEQTDKIIQSIAEHSNEDAVIVTEAMADVLIKQGKTEKARELYEKLSLQNPAKSAYFAAKINSLSTGS